MDKTTRPAAHTPDLDDAPRSESRRGFLKFAAATGAVISMSRTRAFANGDIAYHAKDLSDDKLVDMYRTVLRIRWHERTQADEMLTNYTGFT